MKMASEQEVARRQKARQRKSELFAAMFAAAIPFFSGFIYLHFGKKLSLIAADEKQVRGIYRRIALLLFLSPFITMAVMTLLINLRFGESLITLCGWVVYLLPTWWAARTHVKLTQD